MHCGHCGCEASVGAAALSRDHFHVLHNINLDISNDQQTFVRHLGEASPSCPSCIATTLQKRVVSLC